MHRLSLGGGVQTVVRALAEHLDPREFETVVLSARPLDPRDELGRLPIEVCSLQHVARRYGWWDRLQVVVGAARAARRVRPDVVHLHSGTSWMGVLVRVVLPRAGFVLEVHDAPGSGRHGWLTDRAEGLWCRVGGATVVCHSSSVASEVRSRWRPRADRLVQFPLAVDTERFRPAVGGEAESWRRLVGVPVGWPVVLVVGRLARSKRYDLAVRAVAVLRDRGVDVGLVVVGDGVEGDSLRALVDELGVGDRVWFTGQLVGDELAVAFRCSDVVCSPSEYEGFGLTLVEAMASGVAVVAVAVGGVTDIVVEGETGLLVPSDRPGELVEVLQGLVADRELVEEVGRRGRRRAQEHFGLQSFAQSFGALYRSSARPSAVERPDRKGAQ